jgi:class 3 adenylate cyclase
MDTPKADILIVDDNPANLDVLSNLLITHDYEVRAAINGQMALMAVENSPPDLILLDINMPEMDGYEVCERLKMSEQVCDIAGGGKRSLSEIPIIFISASDEPFDKIKAFSMGAVDYVTKPFQIEEVLVRINHQLTIYRQNLELRERYLQIQQLQGVLRQYISGRAWETIIANDANGNQATHRRETLTILMSDVQGFTSMSEQVDPNLLLADLSFYMQTLSSIVYAHEGEIDKFLGDGMLAFFTKPQRALRAAIAIQQELTRFNEQQQTNHRSPMPTRIGLATGKVLLARIGSDERKEYTLIGDRVNVAARLQSTAPVGGMVMDMATYEQAACILPAAPASIPLKGKQEPERVYVVEAQDILGMNGGECE